MDTNAWEWEWGEFHFYFQELSGTRLPTVACWCLPCCERRLCLMGELRVFLLLRYESGLHIYGLYSPNTSHCSHHYRLPHMYRAFPLS
jgi:hypothetical protein